jgi:cob(I)alamin adenosyltransferase
MKIYTRTGDDGTTGMIGGTRTSKSDPRIESYGTVDELNAALGLCACIASGESLEWIRRVQNELFVIGSHLALPADAPQGAVAHLPPMNEALIEQLEQEIDRMEAFLPPLSQFILPGGSELAARLHLARAISRRAERLTVVLSPQSNDTRLATTYLNRLSDWLFVLARFANHLSGTPDIPWKK